jgi:hypothetical protein
MARKLGLLAARALRMIGNAAVILWFVLVIFAPLNIAGEGKEIAAIMAIPVLLLWLLGRYASRLLDHRG